MSATPLLTITEFCAWARIGRTKAYEEISTGALRAIKIGRRTLIRLTDADDWLNSMPNAVASEITA